MTTAVVCTGTAESMSVSYLVPYVTIVGGELRGILLFTVKTNQTHYENQRQQQQAASSSSAPAQQQQQQRRGNNYVLMM